MKKYLLFALFALILIPVFAFTLSNAALADSNSLFWNNEAGEMQNTIGLGNADPRAMAAKVVNIMLGFLGIIAVIIILLGGFRWMTAAGNEDKVGEAKRIIGAGVIGMVIILGAFGVAQFVLEALYGATGAG
jgi:hypothetical protein